VRPALFAQFFACEPQVIGRARIAIAHGEVELLTIASEAAFKNALSGGIQACSLLAAKSAIASALSVGSQRAAGLIGGHGAAAIGR
jgi:hypothetical protein